MSDYFNIHSLLAEETLLPVKFRYGATRVSRMLGGSNTTTGKTDVNAGAGAELPIWLARALGGKELISVKRPTFLGDKIQRRLNAGAACENLRARCPYFYAAAKDYAELGDEQDVDLATVIYNAFRERYHKLAGGALGLDTSDDLNEFRQRMSQEELNLFEGSQTASLQVQSWQYDHQVTTAALQNKKW